ncbi:acetyltransferase [Amycolatopsis keratiniphila]|uniref:Acetyltransferase n=1 Tax=Amycolatopsis keratiniphila TaxID=129921 RepID=R4T0T5_9PSEU|nr:acetyltransferase [Amycolatopsis keratiniphila]
MIRKLYTLPRYRGSGPWLLEVLIGRLPADVGRVYAEHLLVDEFAGLFFERGGFTVERIEPGGVVRRARPRPDIPATGVQPPP